MEFQEVIKGVHKVCAENDCETCPFYTGDCMMRFILISEPEKAEQIVKGAKECGIIA